MIKASKDDSRIVPRFALPQSYPPFAIRGAPAPLLAHVGTGHKVLPPPASELAAESDF